MPINLISFVVDLAFERRTEILSNFTLPSAKKILRDKLVIPWFPSPCECNASEQLLLFSPVTKTKEAALLHTLHSLLFQWKTAFKVLHPNERKASRKTVLPLYARLLLPSINHSSCYYNPKQQAGITPKYRRLCESLAEQKQ